jgi:hypothetical protein
MRGMIHRLAIVIAAALAPLAFVTVMSPGVSNAVGCGQGTVYDTGSDTCVAAERPPPPDQPPPPPPPSPPAWNGPTPYVSASICAPIPFVSLCVGI